MNLNYKYWKYIGIRTLILGVSALLELLINNYKNSNTTSNSANSSFDIVSFLIIFAIIELVNISYSIHISLGDKIAEKIKANNEMYERLLKLEFISEKEVIIEKYGEIIKKLSGALQTIHLSGIEAKYKNWLRQQLVTKHSNFIDKLKYIEDGTISVRRLGSITLTKECMKLSKAALAISYPDVEFWSENKDADKYLKAHEISIKAEGKVSRYFCIRNNPSDLQIVSDSKQQELFIANLRKQLKIGVNIYIVDFYDANWHDLDIPDNEKFANNEKNLPDISLFDNAICSNWINKHHNDVSHVNISFFGVDVAKAKKVFHFIEQKLNNYEITKDTTDEEIVKLLQSIERKYKSRNPSLN